MTDDYESITTLDAYEDDETSLESEDTVEQLSIAMFEGDTSFLFPEQRQCLHALLKHRYISAEQHPTQWAALMENETLIRGRLHDLFLELEVDRTHQLAFKRAATPEADEPASLVATQRRAHQGRDDRFDGVAPEVFRPAPRGRRCRLR